MRDRARAVIGALTGLVLGLQAFCAQAETPVPERSAPVTDLTGLLRDQTITTLNQLLRGFERATGNQVAVLLVPSTEPEELDDFGIRVMRAWELGGAQGRGVLLLWSEEGQITMPVTPGLAAALPPDKRSEIFTTWIVPRFAEGDADSGILAGVSQIIAAIAQSPMALPAQTPQDTETQIAESPTEMPAEASVEIVEELNAASSSPALQEAEQVPMAEESLSVPSWLSELTSIIGGFDADPSVALRTLWTNAGAQARALPDRFDQLFGAWSQRPGEAAIARSILTAAVILLVLWKPGPAIFWLGLLAAPLIAYFTGFTALSLLIAAAAIVLPLILPLLRKFLARSDDEDDEAGDLRKPFAQQAQQTQSLATSRAQAPARPTAGVRSSGEASTLSKTASAGAASRSQPMPAALRPGAPALKLAELVRGVRLWQVIVAVVVTLAVPVLGVMLIIGWLLWRTSQSAAGNPVLQSFRRQIEEQLRQKLEEQQRLRKQQPSQGRTPPR